MHTCQRGWARSAAGIEAADWACVGSAGELALPVIG
jgi:hypothetical protein